jgi:hypothetical protein
MNSPQSAIYQLFARAMAERKQILCSYNGYLREICPVILGHTRGQEVALTFQFAGDSERGLPRAGAWRCLYLARVRNATLRDGPWHTGSSHNQPSTCVEEVDLDVNPKSPYDPKRRL